MNKFIRKFMKQKKIFLIVEFIILLAIILLGCLFVFSGEKENKNKLEPNNNNNNNNNQNVEVEDDKKVSIVDINTKSRPYAVMINNISTARPLQSGLQDAYLIYEFIVEGGITRYLALFLDANTERIGSIRSARHYYLDYALENDAIYVHHGKSPQAESDFSTLKIDRIEVDNTKTGWRDKSLNVSSEHTLFTNIEKLNSGIGNKRTTRNNELLFDYSADAIDLSNQKDATKANNITIEYSKSIKNSYKYDEKKQVYKRFINNKAHKDYVTEEQYTFKNIITYQVKNTTIPGDTYGRQNLDNIGNGTGYYITNGYAVKINWEKECRKCQTKYTYLDGSEVVLNDGNTFIQIQPKDEKLTIS